MLALTARECKPGARGPVAAPERRRGGSGGADPAERGVATAL